METLVSDVLVNFTAPLLEDNVLKVFVHKSVEPVRFLHNLFKETEELVDFDIKVLKKSRHAEVTFREVKSINYPPVPNAIGLADPDLDTGRWDVYVQKDVSFSKKWILAHEFGHTLGFEHPFSDTDGDIWPDATTDDTVMAYDYRPSRNWFWRKADRDTLTGLYS